jgi:hypothetical protein
MRVFTVMVRDNSDADATAHVLGRYLSREEAIAACKRRVEASLAELFVPGMRAETLFQHFCLFGEEAFIAETTAFSAWDDARQQADVLGL